MTVENNPKRLTRRDFIRGTVGATLAISVLGVPWAKGSEAAGRSSIVTVVRDKCHGCRPQGRFQNTEEYA